MSSTTCGQFSQYAGHPMGSHTCTVLNFLIEFCFTFPPLFSACCLLWGVRSIVPGRVWPRNHQSMFSENLFVSHPCMVQCSPAGPRRSSSLGDTQTCRLLVGMLACYVWCLGREVGAVCTKQHKELRLARAMRFDRCNFSRCSPEVVGLWL